MPYSALKLPWKARKSEEHNHKMPLKMLPGEQKRGILHALDRNDTFGCGKWLKSTKPLFWKRPKIRTAWKWILQRPWAFSCLPNYENIRQDCVVRLRSAILTRSGTIKRSRSRSRIKFADAGSERRNTWAAEQAKNYAWYSANTQIIGPIERF